MRFVNPGMRAPTHELSRDRGNKNNRYGKSPRRTTQPPLNSQNSLLLFIIM
jgi:hypothetical protein